jgi:hypothetical protein
MARSKIIKVSIAICLNFYGKRHALAGIEW